MLDQLISTSGLADILSAIGILAMFHIGASLVSCCAVLIHVSELVVHSQQIS